MTQREEFEAWANDALMLSPPEFRGVCWQAWQASQKRTPNADAWTIHQCMRVLSQNAVDGFWTVVSPTGQMFVGRTLSAASALASQHPIGDSPTAPGNASETVLSTKEPL